MHQIAKKIVTNEAMQIVAIQIDYADWLKIEPLFNNNSRFFNMIPLDKEPFPKDLSHHQRLDPAVFLAEIEAIHQKLSHLPPLTDEILEMAKVEGRR